MTFGDASLQDGGDDPVVFGIALTPPILGGALAVLGIGAAAYLTVQLVMPAWQKYAEVRADVAAKELLKDDAEQERQRIQAVYDRLDRAKEVQSQMLALFPAEETLVTLPLDLNQIVSSKYGSLMKFTPESSTPVLVTDGSWGQKANNKLNRQKVSVVFEGDFKETGNILRTLEQYQSMLAIDDLQTEMIISNQPVRFDAKTSRLVPQGDPKVKISTAFNLDVLTPLSAEELAKQAAAAAAAAEGENDNQPGS